MLAKEASAFKPTRLEAEFLCLKSQNKNIGFPISALPASYNMSRAALMGQYLMRQNSKLLLVMRIKKGAHYMQDSTTVHVG